MKAGTNRFVWDLTHDGADVIPGAVVDSGNPGRPVPVAPGTYTVKLTVGKQSLGQKVEVTPDPRAGKPKSADGASNGDTAEPEPSGQERLALRLRADLTKLAQTVLRIRALQKQITLRKELLKDQADAKPLLKDTDALVKKLDALEGKLHNPKARITYDVFAARGGAMLYSQLTWLLGWVADGAGEPTKAQTELADELEKQLTGYAAEFGKLAKDDLAKLNAAAKKLGVPELYLPPAKAKEKEKPDDGK